VAEPPVSFAGVLRQLRTGVRLTQEELAAAAGLSTRSVSDLERGVVTTPHKDTVRLLADALQLSGWARVQFEAASRGRAGTVRADGGLAATRTLPRDIAAFTGRRQELSELLDAAAGADAVVGIHAIGGMAGIGKTAFAVHAAHRLAGQFPGGQIFLPLHGHTPGQQPVRPAEALASLLLVIGIPAARIPSDLTARIALWRDRVAGKQLLLILDDAAGSEQVRPLLPGADECLVLVTSRRRLSALEDARTISLDTLPPEDAAGLLARLAGRPGLSAADPAVADIARLCGSLPLAIGMLASQLRHHPTWTVAGRAAELAAAVDRLGLLATENVSVAAAFDLTYSDLEPGQQRLFRRLGLHPGADVDAYAAAALDGTDVPAADRGLAALYDQHLLTESAPGRYRMHDLIREHARVLAGRHDTADDRAGATERLLDYYQHATAVADALVASQNRAGPGPAAEARPTAVPMLADREQALAWARAERASLLACLDQLTAAGAHARIVALTAGLAGLLRAVGPWDEAITRHAAAVQAARRLGDRLGLTRALNELGDARRLTGDYRGAVRDLEEALGISRDLGDRAGEAHVLAGLGVVRLLTDDYPAATRDLQEALGIFLDLGDRPGQANVFSYLGRVGLMTGDYPAAASDLQEALHIHRDLGDRPGQASALIELGRVRRLTGDYRGAAQDLQEALGIHRDLDSRPGQASALTFLGNVQHLTGDYLAAARHLQEALTIYRELGSRLGQANAAFNLGIVRRLTGDWPGAARYLEEALSIYRDIGSRGGEVTTLNEIGTLSRNRDDLDRALACHEEALNLAREIGSAWDEAHALAGLGRCSLAAGQAVDAKAKLQQALEVFRRLGAAETADVSAELDAFSE
jgi:tetratricopeptide (TPR) repeat protein/transcriptional regulator with XRE-family HTH domain